jgi:hypothetical protein
MPFANPWGKTPTIAAICGAFLFELVLSVPFHAQQASVKRQDELLDKYDYIVVGAGTAGLTVADRISESGECEFLAASEPNLDF